MPGLGGSVAAVPTLVFDSADFADGQALAIWADSVPYEAFMPHGVAPEQFRCRMQAWRTDSLVVTAGFQCAMRLVRTLERVAADGRDNLCLMLTLDGGWSADFDGLDVMVPRGRVGVIDFSRPFSSLNPDSRFVMLSVPRPKLAIAGDDAVVERHGRVIDGVSGRLLADHFEALARLLPETQADDLPTMAEATLAMVRSCLANTPRRERPRALLSLRQRVRAYVNAHLTDPELTPERVAEALFITRSTLYRAFPSAGVSAYIRSRRLEAIRALLDNPAETRSLFDLAAAFGFASHAHLTTAFGRRFGYPPSRARRGSAPGPVGAASSPEAFQMWLSELDASAQATAHRHDDRDDDRDDDRSRGG